MINRRSSSELKLFIGYQALIFQRSPQYNVSLLRYHIRPPPGKSIVASGWLYYPDNNQCRHFDDPLADIACRALLHAPLRDEPLEFGTRGELRSLRSAS